jgi:hypothetical protein
MYSAASSCGIESCSDSPWALSPYTIPKLTAFARERSPGPI